MTPTQFSESIAKMSVFEAAFEGSLVGDALAMPVHWYYDTNALKREYGVVDSYMTPKHPHSGSILWRSQFQSINEKDNILRDQAKYWGQKDIHYHQFLKAGENTLNFQLARELSRLVKTNGVYDFKIWLERYISCMLTPRWHNDTYIEEYHRAFFKNYAKGMKPRKCGVDDKHIGGLATVPALIYALEGNTLEVIRAAVQEHVSLTHRNTNVLKSADLLVTLLFAVANGESLRGAIARFANDWFSRAKAETWITKPDSDVVGSYYSSACYIEDAMPSSLYLAWKYEGDFLAGLVANNMVGGDNCHRAAVVGSLLGAAAHARSLRGAHAEKGIEE